jgi:hypothetical protein
MKKIFAILALVGVVATGVAQNITKPGLYNKRGVAVKSEAEPTIVSVTLRVVCEHFTPGVYARHAQKYLGERATLSEYTTAEIVDGRLALGATQKAVPTIATGTTTTSLPAHKLSATSQTNEAQAAKAAEMIFSLRRHRLDLITGEMGENVFGAGLKNALEEIERIESECLEMFYGTKTTTEEVYTFNIVVTPDKTEYVVCRFNDKAGVVADDDLSGKPIVLKVETEKHKEYKELLLPLGPKDKVSAEYVIVPQSKCSLIIGAELKGVVEFASLQNAKTVTALPIK